MKGMTCKDDAYDWLIVLSPKIADGKLGQAARGSP